MPIVEEYLSLTKKYKIEYGEKTLLLYQVGSFFEVYALKDKNGKLTGSNIEDFSNMNDMIIAEKSKVLVDKKKVVMAGFGLAQLDKYVKKIQEHGYTIIVYTQDIQGKNTTRSLSEIISPGTFFTNDSTELSNNTMCIWLHTEKANKIIDKTVTIGISNIDIFTGKTSIFQITKKYYHNPCTYDDLERYISIFNPIETLIVSNMENNLIDDIIEYINLNSKKIHKINQSSDTSLSKFSKQAEKQVYQRGIFNNFYPNLSSEYFVSLLSSHYIAIQSFTLLLDFVSQHCLNLVNKLSTPNFENYTDRLILANHSLKQLNIIDDSRYTGKHRSIGTLLNNCVTKMGKRQFAYNIHNPVTTIDELNKSYNITEYVLTIDKYIDYREILNTIQDLEKFDRKLVLKKITPKDLSKLSNDLIQITSLYSLTKGDKKISKFLNTKNIDKLCRTILTDLCLNFNLEKCSQIDDISIEKLNTLPSELLTFINTGISSEIDNLLNDCLNSRKMLQAISENLSKLIGEIEKNSKTASFIKVHETPKTEPVLMGTKRRMTLLKSQLESKKLKTININYKNFNNEIVSFDFDLTDIELKTIGSNKKDLIVSNNFINSVSKNILIAENKLSFEIHKFYQKFINNFLQHQEILTNIIEYVTQMDILQCKAYIANKYNYFKPEIKNSNKSFFSFEGIRHPLIEHLQTNELYVTNDLTLGTENNKDGLLLYGTNAVGKTSFIKSVGIAVIMAQAGLYVAASNFTFFPYKSIFTRILGNDNIFKGLSTFAVEMSELRTILNMADENSLILGDELCSGTESDSALSIFTTGLEILHNKSSTFLFATHFHEIINYSEIQDLNKLSMMHMEVKYDKVNDILIYDRKLKDGPGESMYGLEVCKSLNLPDEFLKRAHDIRMKYNPITKNILNESVSHFNVKKIKGMCELCKNKKSTEVHHLQHQKNANDSNSYIDSFHKNHLANLFNVCEDCHNLLHNSKSQHKITKTSEGYKLSTI